MFLRDGPQGAGVDVDELARTVKEFNAAIDRDVPLGIAVKDGHAARVTPPSPNWTIPLEEPPYYAFPVMTAIPARPRPGGRAHEHRREIRLTLLREAAGQS